uniref:Uncharacterized protein n=1 Tax=Nelumbo nucifera TaxID=4432 RepID=A0A822Y019_NELNU|nr:TPA_asm: hypothetical protein HUJ06_026060 [Nelumbo nucifera]
MKKKSCSPAMNNYVSKKTLSPFFCAFKTYPSNHKQHNLCTIWSSGKKEKSMLSDLEKACADKIAAAEDSIKKKKQVSYWFIHFQGCFHQKISKKKFFF